MLAGSLAIAQTADATYPGRNGRIAYDASIHALPVPQLLTETVLPDGRGRRELGDFAGVAWAASGRRLVASTYVGSVPTIVLANDRGQVLRVIPRPIGPDGRPMSLAPVALSPNGRVIALLEDVVDPYAQPEQVVSWIWTMRADGTQLRRLARGQRPRWTPEGKRIVFEREDAVGGYAGIASMRTDGSDKRQLIDGYFKTEARLLDLAPDGRRLLWWGSYRRGEDRRGWVAGLFTSDLRARNPKLVSRRHTQGSGAFSPDGTKLVFAVDDLDLRGTFTANATGGERRRLLRRPRLALAWQPRPGR